MFQATRCRLALWYTAVTAILLCLFATGVYLYVRTTLIDRIDDTLKHVVEIVERSLVIENVTLAQGKYRVNLEASFRQNTEAVDVVEEDHIDLEWFGPNGELLWSNLSESLPIPLCFNSGAKTIHISSDFLLRQVTKRIQIGRYILGYLRVSHPWFEVTKPIRQLSVDLSLGISLMIISVAALGWFLSGIAIKPVRESYQSLKQFTADASHELRNPIAMIQTNIQMLLSYPDTEAETQQRQLKVLERLAQRLGNLVNDLLFLARSDSGIVKADYQPVPLDALLIEVIEEQKIIAEQKGIKLLLKIVTADADNHHQAQIEMDEEIFTIQGDWNQLVRLFTNLISNALEYAMTAGENRHDLVVEVILKEIKKQQKNYLQIQVKDNGIGIPEQALPYLFDRFYRLDTSRSSSGKNSFSGTGLGLAIARAIVENHQGQIKVESMLNQGTTFTVILPITNLSKYLLTGDSPKYLHNHQC
jgi:OmpR-family two-component system manganese-sensing sensor histidine kinase